MAAPSECDLLITADMAIIHGGVTLENAGVVIRGGHITSVGSAESLVRSHAPEKRIDLGPALLLPGLVNAHTHLPMTLLKGIADDLPLLEWLRDHIWPVEGQLTPELLHLGALLGCAEMIRTGTTAFLNGYISEENTGKAVDESGIRAILGEGFFGFPSPMFPTAQDCWDVIRSLEHTYDDHERIRTAVTPHAVFTVKPDELAESHALAEELDVAWQIHLAESPEETADCLTKTAKRPVELLHSLGILDHRCTLHHCVDVTHHEIGLIAEAGAKVSHNPASNLKLASGIAPVQAMLDAGVSVGIGTDGSASNNQLNMFREMGLAALCGKVRDRDASAVSAASSFAMATEGSARCLHWPELGAIETGRPADLCALSLSEPNMLPMNDPVSHCAYAATGHEVMLTVCAGKILYRDGRFTTLDMDALRREAEAVRRWILSRRK
ncbi:amidohydrolase [Salidesulfovibrio brasiliensis]|uniref:amidohydrolase n=1 Tax=Salidesulfovibrio brasiliensis TaxID=221711 RepID=UPI0006CF3807|nr:amidohydrolase [Salidesulfovibrio brasiliensis]